MKNNNSSSYMLGKSQIADTSIRLELNNTPAGIEPT